MKSLRMHSDRSLYFRELPMPGAPGPGQVLVRMAYASICGYDIMMLRGQAANAPNGELGHEGSAIVEAVGPNVRQFRPGDAVAVNPYTTCGHCDACRGGHPAYCVNPGGRSDLMTEYLILDQDMVYRLPEGVSLRAGSLIEPLMMAMHAVRKAQIGYGKNVIILGCGAMGQIILKLTRQHPVGKIVVVEPDASKRNAAYRFGADVVLNPHAGNLLSEALMLSDGKGYDAVIEASGDRASAQNSINLVARGGSVVFFGLYGMEFNLELNLFNLYWKDASVSAVCVPHGQFPAALRMAARLNLEEVITGMFPFEQAIEAFGEKEKGGHAKVMLEFGKRGSNL